MHRYIKYFDYYLEVLAKKLSGRGLGEPKTNGEFLLMHNILKSHKDENDFVFVDGGANVGEHIIEMDRATQKYNQKNVRIVAVEAFPETQKALLNATDNITFDLIPDALGDSDQLISFYSAVEGDVCGQNSAIKHHFLNHEIKVRQRTLDDIVDELKIEKINFLKLDIEGMEYRALIGARRLLEGKNIDFIQMEYNQTWIQAGASIEKVLKLCKTFDYSLYRINRKALDAIPRYNFSIDDFYFCNLLMVRNGLNLPLPSRRAANPLLAD